MNHRKVGLAALTVLDLPAPEQVVAAARAGYDFVGLRLIPVAGQVLPSFTQRELERALAATGLAVLDVEIFRIEPATDVGAFEPVLEQAARLKASDLLVHGADPEESRLMESFGALCDLAARYGLAANLEPMPWVSVSTVSKARRILDATRRPNAALLVDPIHFFRADNALAELKGAALRYAQFCDAHPGRPAEMQEVIRQARGDRLLPGEGALDLRGLLGAMPEDLLLSLEIPMAKRVEPFERARLALEATRRFLAAA